MRSLLITLILLITALSSRAQYADTVQVRKMNEAGVKLIQFHKSYSVGVGLMGLGIGFTAAGAFMSENGKVSPLIYGGGAVTVAGMIVMMSSFGNIKEAGQLLIDEKTSIRLNSQGVGVVREF